MKGHGQGRFWLGLGQPTAVVVPESGNIKGAGLDRWHALVPVRQRSGLTLAIGYMN